MGTSSCLSSQLPIFLQSTYVSCISQNLLHEHLSLPQFLSLPLWPHCSPLFFFILLICCLLLAARQFSITQCSCHLRLSAGDSVHRETQGKLQALNTQGGPNKDKLDVIYFSSSFSFSAHSHSHLLPFLINLSLLLLSCCPDRLITNVIIRSTKTRGERRREEGVLGAGRKQGGALKDNTTRVWVIQASGCNCKGI